MIKLATDLINSKSCYFGDADSYTMKVRKLPQKTIINNLKLSSMIYEYTIFSAAYFWASDEMSSITNYLKPLIASGNILPAVRSPKTTRDIVDYFDARLVETSNINKRKILEPFRGTIANENDRGIAKKLDSYNTILYLNDKSISDVFSNLVVHDLMESNRNIHSLHNILALYVDENKKYNFILDFKSFLSNSYLSRATISKYILSLNIDNKLKSRLLNRFSNLYMRSNAIACNSDLLITSKESKNTASLLQTSNIDLFVKVLTLIGIEEKTLQTLTPLEIIEIKQSREFKSFIKYYYSIINSISKEEKNVENALWNKFQDRKRSDNQKKTFLRTMNHFSYASAPIFFTSLGAVLSENTLLARSLVAASGAVSLVSYIVQKIQWFQDQPIVSYLEYMTKEKYKEELHKHIKLESI